MINSSLVGISTMFIFLIQTSGLVLKSTRILRGARHVASSCTNSGVLVPSKAKFICRGEIDLLRFGAELSKVASIGDVFLLSGDLGAGKTTLTRGFLRELCRRPNMVVTSPTYLLDNTYSFPTEDGSRVAHHMDLYRLPSGCDATILGIPEIFGTSISLIEWPQRLPELEPEKAEYLSLKNRLEVEIRIDENAGGRNVSLNSFDESWQAKCKKVEAAFNRNS